MFSGCSPFPLANLGQCSRDSSAPCQDLWWLGQSFFLLESCFCLTVATDEGSEMRLVQVQAVHRRLAPSTSSAASQFHFFKKKLLVHDGISVFIMAWCSN